ncbi:unnamed protein product [Camellia sinensis]
MAKKRTSFMKCVEDFRARVYLQLNKIFQCSVASISQSQTSSGLLLLRGRVMGVPAYLQPDLEADLVLPPAPASRVDNHAMAHIDMVNHLRDNSENTRSDRNVIKGAWAARIQRNKMR